jgi:predicted metal-dependent hydrolase
MINYTLSWPPSYIITRKKQARHITTKITKKKGLEFVVPKRFNKKLIPRLLETNKAWIREHLQLLRQEIKTIKTASLPRKINLPAVNQLWRVKYKSATSKMNVITDSPHKIVTLIGNIKNKSECRKHLIAWLKTLAKKLLTQKLNRISALTGLQFKDVIIRDQAGHWASCSDKKRISLNYKIIFIPAILCKHILTHELCHTVQMNHSRKFWRLLSTFDRRWKAHDEAFQHLERMVPAWAHHLK